MDTAARRDARPFIAVLHTSRRPSDPPRVARAADGVVELPLGDLVAPRGHVVVEIVEADLVLRGVDDVRRVGLLPTGGLPVEAGRRLLCRRQQIRLGAARLASRSAFACHRTRRSVRRSAMA